MEQRTEVWLFGHVTPVFEIVSLQHVDDQTAAAAARLCSPANADLKLADRLVTFFSKTEIEKCVLG